MSNSIQENRGTGEQTSCLNNIQLNLEDHSEPRRLWDPTKSVCIKQEDTKYKQFQAFIETKYNTNFNGYESFHKWSVENFTDFWEDFWHFSEIIYSQPYKQVLKPLLRQTKKKHDFILTAKK